VNKPSARVPLLPFPENPPTPPLQHLCSFPSGREEYFDLPQPGAIYTSSAFRSSRARPRNESPVKTSLLHSPQPPLLSKKTPGFEFLVTYFLSSTLKFSLGAYPSDFPFLRARPQSQPSLCSLCPVLLFFLWVVFFFFFCPGPQ